MPRILPKDTERRLPAAGCCPAWSADPVPSSESRTERSNHGLLLPLPPRPQRRRDVPRVRGIRLRHGTAERSERRCTGSRHGGAGGPLQRGTGLLRVPRPLLVPRSLSRCARSPAPLSAATEEVRRSDSCRGHLRHARRPGRCIAAAPALRRLPTSSAEPGTGIPRRAPCPRHRITQSLTSTGTSGHAPGQRKRPGPEQWCDSAPSPDGHSPGITGFPNSRSPHRSTRESQADAPPLQWPPQPLGLADGDPFRKSYRQCQHLAHEQSCAEHHGSAMTRPSRPGAFANPRVLSVSYSGRVFRGAADSAFPPHPAPGQDEV